MEAKDMSQPGNQQQSQVQAQQPQIQLQPRSPVEPQYTPNYGQPARQVIDWNQELTNTLAALETKINFIENGVSQEALLLIRIIEHNAKLKLSPAEKKTRTTAAVFALENQGVKALYEKFSQLSLIVPFNKAIFLLKNNSLDPPLLELVKTAAELPYIPNPNAENPRASRQPRYSEPRRGRGGSRGRGRGRGRGAGRRTKGREPAGSESTRSQSSE